MLVGVFLTLMNRYRIVVITVEKWGYVGQWRRGRLVECLQMIDVVTCKRVGGNVEVATEFRIRFGS